MKGTDQLVAFLREALAPYFLAQDTWQVGGSWTPALQGATTAGVFTYNTTVTGGQYLRLGNRVLFNGRIQVTAIGTPPTGSLRITGLPYPSASAAVVITGAAAVGLYQGFTLPAGYTQVGLHIGSAVSHLNITRSGSNVAQADMAGADLVLVGGVANIDFVGQYWLS